MPELSMRSAIFLAVTAFAVIGSACSFQAPAASLSGGAVGGVSGAGSQATVYPFDAIVVTGFGSASGAPDFAKLSLGVSVTADTVAAARNDAAEAMADVRAALKRQRILDSDIATSHFRIHPQYEYGPDGREQLGYTVSNGLTVTVRNIDKVAAVIDSTVAAGGDNLIFNTLEFSFLDPAELEKTAREAAVENMREKATQLAEFSDRELGELKVVSEGIFHGSDLISGAVMLRAESASFDTPISAGEGAVTVSISGVYELK